ncbi:ABC transporter permease [Flavobacterium croceum]|uniref:ABC transporter permease n=1 Tax=Flavobacterium croceum TaxID=370975 RepID=UPI0024A8DB0F|nr:ABC transporter permease [Flavobacterium croceum]
MIRLLQLEWLKNLSYKPFKIFSVIYFTVLIALLFIGLVDFSIGNFTINLKEQGIYNFPQIWNFTTWIVGLFKIFLGCIIIFSICQEFTNRMFKQNTIDGLSRKEFIFSKLLTILIFTTFSTLFVLFVSLYLGYNYSEKTSFNLVTQEIYFIPNYFIKLFTFFTLLMFLSIVLRKSMFVFLGIFALWVLEGIFSVIEMKTFYSNLSKEQLATKIQSGFTWSKFLPLESTSGLIPNPMMRLQIAEMLGGKFSFQYPTFNLVASLLWATLFILASYWILKKRDW